MKKILVVLLIGAILGSCQNGNKKSSAGAGEAKSIAAAGATFPMPYYNMVIKSYIKEKGMLVTYGGIGSGGGIKSLKDKVV